MRVRWYLFMLPPLALSLALLIASQASFLRGSPLLAPAPSLLSRRFMAGFGSCEVPVPCPPLPMYLIWHRRHQDDAAHRWLRELLASNSPPTA